MPVQPPDVADVVMQSNAHWDTPEGMAVGAALVPLCAETPRTAAARTTEMALAYMVGGGADEGEDGGGRRLLYASAVCVVCGEETDAIAINLT